MRRFVHRDRPTGAVALVSAMTRRVHAAFAYTSRLEVGTQTPAETLHLRAGSCRDFEVLMIDTARSLGLAARFVSGDLYSRAQSGEVARRRRPHPRLGARGPAVSWLGGVRFHNGIVGSTDLVGEAVARDPCQALPLSGTWMGKAEDYLGMDVDVHVRVGCDGQTWNYAAWGP